MTMRHKEPVECECGHQGTLHWSENDAPFSKQWEEYSMSGFDAEGFYINGFTTSHEALIRMKPKCPSCGETGRVKLA